MSPPGGGPPDLQKAVDTNVRPLCNEAQPSSPSVCQPSLRSSGMGSRCAFVRLGSDGGLRLSPILPDTSDPEENQVKQLSDPPSGSLVATEALVQRSSGPSAGLPETYSKKTRPTVSKENSSRLAKHVQTSRLAVIRQALRKKCFSSRASLLIASARRQSTRTVYDAKWRVHSDRCVRRKMDPIDPSPQRIADFLIYLFDVKKLKVATIKGYRSMLSHTLSFRKSTACAEPMISELIRAFEIRRPVTRSLAPKWDLACVLWSLTKAPYEPLDQASLQLLTWKTVFLLTLASAKRRSEITLCQWKNIIYSSIPQKGLLLFFVRLGS